MLNVIGSAAALSKIRGDDYERWLSATEALTAGTQGGARGLGFGTELGVIERGAIADLTAYRLDTVTFTPLNDPIRQLVYGERGAGLDFAMVAGDVVLRDGRFTRFDELRLLTEIQAEFETLEPQYAVAEASVAPMRAGSSRSIAARSPPPSRPTPIRPASRDPAHRRPATADRS
jgi:5-methylthioadenosine/S-adenosylhomocysteine deaminase